MEAAVSASVAWLLAALALPAVGLPAIFIISLVSATLLPLGSEPAVFAYVKLAADMFWPAVIVATVGNTLGGIITYGMGCGMFKAWNACRAPVMETVPALPSSGSSWSQRWHQHAARWLERLGPRAAFFSWLPAIGDPLCAVAGWMRFAFWPTVAYMALGKFLRYTLMTAALLWAFPNA